jgi:hypothetical protein
MRKLAAVSRVDTTARAPHEVARHVLSLWEAGNR